MQTMLDSYDPVKNKGLLCFEYLPGSIRLFQFLGSRKKHTFSVQYGKQLDHDLTYSEACAKLGQALLHHLSCEGKDDNERD
ncbi:hypothetical protein HYP99_gp001 [Sinorhizobium phage ort11]|uniref:Uncharacterized protein n=1 Tax=Sinorhizobium phage ort11 TaxID=2599764 RepID=A0A5C2H8U4_9CAUD|nr:hypothetical protein HYP99_gp001 [Sinorhizobium phage ort11]QEP29799.1 hypothetical protein Smphiort11_001 [Sinorhizobium phage ort11]